MQFNRNQYYLIGLVLLLVGIHFRIVDSLVLSPQVTQFLAKRTGHPVAAVNATAQFLLPFREPVTPRKVVRPPEWLGWAMMSLGGVFTLHALSIKKA